MASSEESKDSVVAKPKVTTSPKRTTLKKVDAETAKLIQQIKDKANKKPFGRKVKDSEIISLAVRQLNPNHIKELQDATLNERDKLNMLHEDYQRSHGKISLDQFIGRLIRGEIKPSATQD